jgi:hypothetical protein
MFFIKVGANLVFALGPAGEHKVRPYKKPAHYQEVKAWQSGTTAHPSTK